jgi:hypothetical protein
MLGQPKRSTMTPPTTGPAASARPPTPAQMLTARARAAASGKLAFSSASEAGTHSAAPYALHDAAGTMRA